MVWRLTDGRRGHENQTLGLVEALARRHPLSVHDLPVPGRLRAFGWWWAGRFPAGAALPDPDLILAAGHRSHPALLAARRARGGRAVVLMRPSLPCRWFDLCLVPEHDDPPRRANVVATRGTLNRIRPGDKREGSGLILVGGPSRHHHWTGEALAEQITELVVARPEVRWTVADSRRTPQGFRALLAGLPVAWVGHGDVGADWFPAALAAAPLVWVSEDSVNMVYEALSAGAAVGVFGLPRRGDGRVARGLDRLLADGLVTDFGRWRRGHEPQAMSRPLDEAARCAQWIEERWLNEH
ncbi:ELM1/GtrOC1 family putative glycosyltransferase [Endothiovibrio diazotrophicus]